MASDLSSECTEAIGVLDEKEEGEISLEDVSSSEEGHLNYGYGSRVSQCSNCLSSQHNAAWCTAPAKFYASKSSSRREVDLILQDAVKGKENRHQIKEPGSVGAKHTTSTLQEKNDDLVPISSDSDMEIIGLADNSKQIVIHSSSKSKMKKKRKKKRSHASALAMEDFVSSASATTADVPAVEPGPPVKHDAAKAASRSHHREASPAGKSSRSRATSRTPPRSQRSVAKTRSPFGRSKSPSTRGRSPTRRSPRRKSPKRSPYRSSTKSAARKTSHTELVSSRNYVETHKLLKKVRQLDAMGSHSLEETLSKNKEHASSLKEKLSNMIKGISDTSNDFASYSSKEKSAKHVNHIIASIDLDDEEDLALLRQKALETKQNKSANKQNDQPKTEATKSVSTNINDDQDEEDLELRMIALRSAVLKKHQNRKNQKSGKLGKSKKSAAPRCESPFTQSFLDSIPIPEDNLQNIALPPGTPVRVTEDNHTEDMDLDTDVEREKEIHMPYSPTDKITADIPMDTELLGIQPSDVSFINLNEANGSPNFNTSVTSSQEDPNPYRPKIIENKSYLPSVSYYSPVQTPVCATNTNAQYSPATNTAETSKAHNSYENDACNMLTTNSASEFADINSNEEMPYSPTDTPIYDPDLSQALPQVLDPLVASLESYNFNVHASGEQYNHISTTQHVQTAAQISAAVDDDQLSKADTLSLDPVVGSATTSLLDSVSPCSSMLTIDDLPEADMGASLMTELNRIESSARAKAAEHIPHDLSGDVNKERLSEPLYMKGVPDVTKDTNKIPTLINRTLVPAPILKTNKQLQLPLPNKKYAAQQEPAFKSAEMQPVAINEESSTKSNASFKPIKLISFPQKPPSIVAVPIAFHDSLHEDSTNETSINNADTSPTEDDQDATLAENEAAAESSDKTIYDVKSPAQKKKRLGKKGLKRRNSITGPVNAKKLNSSGTRCDEASDADKEVCEIEQIVPVNVKPPDREEIQRHMVAKYGISASMLDVPIPDETNVICLETDEEEVQNDTSEQMKNAEDRRQSLDEDEEALRAILLASLPKRTKPSNSCSNSTTLATVSTRTLNQTTTKVASSTVNVVNNTSKLPCVTLRGAENEKKSNAEKKTNNVSRGGLAGEIVKPLNSATSGRKRSVSLTKGPQKKLVKRIPIPASTKVVNNAKKYQNTMIQRKLNLQKATLYNKQKMAENKIVSKVQASEVKWSANINPVPDTQRIVINLESDTESDSETERQKNTAANNCSTIDKQQSALLNPTTEFEKNLEQFLRAARKKQESMAAARPTSMSQTSKKDTILTAKTEKPNPSNLHTPLAVRHLPASQQEEYRRLKQQILEREKLKLHRTIKNNNLVKSKNELKNENINAQQLNKENCSKNLVDTIKNTSGSASNAAQSSPNKISSDEKQENTSPRLTKAMSKSMTNLNIRVSTEKSPNNDANKAGSSTHVGNASRKVFEMAAHKIQSKAKSATSLKILSSDEVNRKFVQVRVKSDTNERAVTINDKVTLKKNAVINRNEDIVESKDNVNKSICDYVRSVENDIINSVSPSDENKNEVDSDVSTVILSEEQQEKTGENTETSQSTIHLSQCKDNIPFTSPPTIKDDDHFLLINTNMSPKTTSDIEKNWDAIKKDVKTELSVLINLSQEEQEEHLTYTEQKLVMKRYTILDDLAEMSSNLRQWHMERDLQTDLVAEVKKLREQLKVAEERLQVQRNRINSIGPKVVAAHSKINASRQECFKLATICSTLGSRTVGKDYKIPEAGAQLLDSRLKEVANHTRQLSRKKVPFIDIPEIYEASKLDEESVSIACSEISQSEYLLAEECDVDNVDTVILNEPESFIEANEIETVMEVEATMVDANEIETVMEVEATMVDANEIETVMEVEATTVDANEPSEESNTISNDSAARADGENTPEPDNNTEEEEVVSNEERSLEDTFAATTSICNSNDTQGHDDTEALEKDAAGPATEEPNREKRICTRLEGEHQPKKTLLPYESILTHFKVPRNTNPNGVLCPYELMGTCSDAECQFIHQTESEAK